MSKKYCFSFGIIVLFLTMISCSGTVDKGLLVSTISEFDKSVSEAKPGDVIVLKNGVWKDTELLFEAEGTSENPIALVVEQDGKVTLEGASNLRIAGNHLIMKRLVFKNGFTRTDEVISFRKHL